MDKENKLSGALLLSDGDIGEETIGNIVDLKALQEMMNFFYNVTHIGIAIDDLKGNIMVATGWQDICTKFHRCHPETLKNCIESDTHLTRKIAVEGEYVIYQCKNGMWDIVTPIIVEEKHIANLFLGQFFFEDEVPDYDFFAKQADNYGFNKEEYMAALDRVPRWSREKVRNVMEFYTRFAGIISKLSFSNLQLARLVIEQRQTEEALRKSEGRFRNLVENINDMVWETDSNCACTYASPRTKQLIGYEPEAILGKKPFEFMPPDDAERMDRIISSIFSEHKSFELVEYRFARKDVGEVFVQTSGMPMFDDEGNFKGYRGVNRDITELKKAEEALRESEMRFRLVADYTNDWSIWIDQNGILTYISPSCERITGYCVEEFLKYPGLLYDIVFPDDRAMFVEHMRSHLTAPGSPGAVDFRILTNCGEVRWIEHKCQSVFGNNGEWLGRRMSNRDITERKNAEDALLESEANLANAQRIAHLGNWVWNVRENRVKCSDESYLIFNIAKQEFITYEQFVASLHPQDRDRVEKAVRSALYAWEPYSIDYRVVRSDGTEHIVHAEAEVTYDQAGKPVSMFGTVQDITERKQVEEALEHAKAHAEMYLDLMGHDINNLNQIGMGYLELALNTLKMDKDAKKLLLKPLEALESSSKLIDNVRKLQNLKEGKSQFHIIDVGHTIREIIPKYSHVPGRDIAINHTLDCVCRAMANDLLNDVFSNIIGNAIKHSSGPLTINIISNKVYMDNIEYCKVIIEDNGPGIPDKIKNKLFTRFQRGTTKASGRGLGLYLVKTIVEDYGGMVLVEDRVPGDHTKGARFVVLLPAAKDIHA